MLVDLLLCGCDALAVMSCWWGGLFLLSAFGDDLLLV